ncbi:hypothetical protein [Ottowia thiooxydans]|uniref:Pimeloyl-ACP methyl ester carboxylesterase n=1 Tax=Ottowia thiooxydans TaxID=219182 RepID=A0ABV2QH90_9BURK
MLGTPSLEGFIDVEGCAIHYIAWGDATKPPLMLIHSNAASASGGVSLRLFWLINMK